MRSRWCAAPCTGEREPDKRTGDISVDFKEEKPRAKFVGNTVNKNRSQETQESDGGHC